MKSFSKVLTFAFMALVSAFTLSAQDKSLLETLTKKGVLTQDEAAEIAKQSVVLTPANSDTKKLKFFGRTQMQYYWADTKADAPDSTPSKNSNGFRLRRVLLGVNADLGAGWKAVGIFDFARTGTQGSDYVYDVYITKDVDYDFLSGQALMGFKKVQFGFEENMSSFSLGSIETSLATRYFTGSQKTNSRLGFGARYVGLQWYGKILQLDGFNYALAVTNSANETVLAQTDINKNAALPADNSLNVWASASYLHKFEDFSLKAGANFGYGPGVNVISATKYGEVMGFNPFVEFKIFDNISIWADYLVAHVEYGKTNGTEDAVPQAFNIGGEYRFDIGELGKLGFYARYSSLFTDGRGLNIRDLVPSSINTASTPDGSTLYNDAQSVYMGLNWYLRGDNLKLQIGYEWAQFSGSSSSRPFDGAKRASANTFRTQLQVMF